MSLEFKRKKSHSTKWSKKYPRARINNKGGDRKAAIAAGWYKFNWNDDHFNFFNSKLVIKFLKANVGRPIDKVFSEFLDKCDSKLRKSYPLKEEFYHHIEKKEDIDWHGGFYVTNGILNYKKRVKFNPVQHSLSNSSSVTFNEAVDYNEDNMPKNKDIVLICEKANKAKSPQYLGNFYVYDSRNIVKKAVYVVDKDAYIPTFETTFIVGCGDGIGLYNFIRQDKYTDTVAMFDNRGVWNDKVRYKLMTKIKRETL